MRESAGRQGAEQEAENHGSGVVGEERKDSSFGERPISGHCYNSDRISRFQQEIFRDEPLLALLL